MRSSDKVTSWEMVHENICAVFESSVKNHAKSVYCSGAGVSLTYEQAFAAVDGLAEELGAGIKGKIVGIYLSNSAAFLIAYQAVLRAGGRPALLNVGLPKASIEKMLDDMDMALIFASEEVTGVPTYVFSDAQLASTLETLSPVEVTPSGATANDTAVILFSGGTTGLPKRISHSHRAVIAMMERMEWGWPTNDNETWLPVAPFSHVYGYLMGVTNPILRGAKVVVPEKFKPDLVVDLMVSERVTVFGGGPPAIYQGIMAAEGFETADLSHLRVCPGGGAPFPVATHEKWEKATGLKIYEGLGMTEIAPLAVNTAEHGTKYGSVGLPCPDTEIEIVDLETGLNVLPANQSGEIRVKGPHMMLEYEGNPEETAITLRDGFIYTGDIGTMDSDGFLTITDRKKDVIFHKGFNVFPREIEEALMQHDAVHQVCVVGREDERSGEVAVAFVCGDDSLDESDILDYCAANLAAYKVPGELRIQAQLPLTAAGKLDRMALRKAASASN